MARKQPQDLNWPNNSGQTYEIQNLDFTLKTAVKNTKTQIVIPAQAGIHKRNYCF